MHAANVNRHAKIPLENIYEILSQMRKTNTEHFLFSHRLHQHVNSFI